MATRTEITVDTYPYKREHGHQPRGYGWWAFRFKGGGVTTTEPYWATGTYTRALQQAKAEAQRLGAPLVEVQP